MGITIAELLSVSADILRDAGLPNARLDAGALLAHSMGCDRTFIITHSDDVVGDEITAQYRELITRRAKGEPLQYIVGHQEFYGLDFEVSPQVLIPRPETELLVDTALDLIEESPSILDVGTGSGCIAITLLVKCTDARGVAVDISHEALQVAQRNARRHLVDHRIEFKVSDCFSAIQPNKQFDLIVSNPPYVVESAMNGLQREVRDFEPAIALTPGGDGLSVIRRLVSEGAEFLKKKGHLLIEIGFDQRDAVMQMVDGKVWELVEIYKDLQGIPRTLTLRKR
jgi:release factor glutamine methyltransferase